MSGLLKGWLDGENWPTALKYANACGAFAVSRHGCTPAYPSWEELQFFFNYQIKRPDLRNDVYIIAQIRTFDLIIEEKLELLPRRVRRCTPMTTDSKRPARIGIFQCGWPVLSVQPALQQARHKPVTCAKHIKHLNRKTRVLRLRCLMCLAQVTGLCLAC